MRATELGHAQPFHTQQSIKPVPVLARACSDSHYIYERIAKCNSVEITIALHLTSYFACSQFGGNLFAMTDPFWMLLVMHQLGNDYFVWDKAGAIDFIAPGREDVYAHFKLDLAVVEQLRANAAGGGKVLHWFETDVITASGEVIARVRKQVYVRLKPKAR